MARIKYSALVESINGSIAGTTFQRNKYGSTVKAKQTWVKPTTYYQSLQKARQSRVAQAWRQLTEANRTAWNNWAAANPRPTRLNPDAYLSGFNLFTAYHGFRYLADNQTLAEPDTTIDSIGEIDVIVYEAAGVLTWEWANPAVTGDWMGLVYLTPPIPLGREFVNTTPKFLTYSTDPIGEQIDITSIYQEKVGTIPDDGEWVGYKIVVLNMNNAQIYITPIAQIQVIAGP